MALINGVLEKNLMMNRDKFNILVSEKPSRWAKNARRRRRWRWFNKLALKPRIRYHKLKFKFKQFLESLQYE